MSGSPRSRAARLGLAALEVGFCVALPLAALSWAFHNAVVTGDVTDFEEAFYPAAEMLRGGGSPYPGIDDPAVAAGVAYVYPPLTAILAIPLTVLSPGAAGVVVMALLVAAVIATLWILGVRDWRCYGVALAWPAVYSGIMAGTLSIPLAFAAAVVWRFRGRTRLAAAGLGIGIALKLILWPLVLWLGATRRLPVALLALAVAVATTVATWAAVGFAGLQGYPELVRRVQDLEESNGYTIYALSLDLGVSSPVARSLALVAAVALLGGVVHLGRRGDDRRAFVLAVAAALACSPIVWLHYFALLLVVVGVSTPRLGPAWFVPLAMYCSTATLNGSTFQTALTLGAAALTVLVALRPTASPRSAFRHAASSPRLTGESG